MIIQNGYKYKDERVSNNMKSYRIVTLLFCVVLLLGVITATTEEVVEPKFIGKTDLGITIYDTCSFNGFACEDSYNCTFTIIAPDKTILISRNSTIHDGDLYYKTLNTTQTSQSGLHEVISYCTNGTYSGEETFYYEINPAGVRQSMLRTVTISLGIIFMFIIAILLFFGFVTYPDTKTTPMKFTYLLLSFTFFLISLNLITVSLADVIINPVLVTFFDSFTAISFILYWFLGGLLALLWMYTTYNTLVYKKMMSDAKKYGEGEGGFGI